MRPSKMMDLQHARLMKENRQLRQENEKLREENVRLLSSFVSAQERASSLQLKLFLLTDRDQWEKLAPGL